MTDVLTKTRDLFDMQAAPLRIGALRLKVRDLERVTNFYTTVLGLEVVERTPRSARLGSASSTLLELQEDPALAPRDPRQAGLFHTAFLLPSRADLARWLSFVRDLRLEGRRVPLQGASDHNVSEAIYLADPEGNGIEVYADHPVSRWRDPDGQIHMTTEPLDLQGLLQEAGSGRWSGFPADGCIGHVHLQVGDRETADRFYRDILGLEVTAHYPGASFYGSGGYHHQLAANVWNSRGSTRRVEEAAGLAGFSLLLRDPAKLTVLRRRAEEAGVEAHPTSDGVTLYDPWGIAITVK